ncbi:efflux RND transporter periplasmic adaptor subunit [Pseudanabaena sp. PCC 6802]|uniref:efflux RND transporter periplasmic adaptor subunit n=1 Tax=Pseudanabaena sp. PCC 6802 TaxID=118173 RepID=UPI00034AE2BE|nr:HlyD family efflux transporter periplasmic adaptor subunit [Pseudanabaena sp. PCC 6802]
MKHLPKSPQPPSESLDRALNNKREPDRAMPDRDKPTAKRSLKKWVYVILGVGVGLALVWAFRPTPIAVDTARVERGDLQVAVNAEGKTRVRDRYTISADVAGQLERIQLKEGDPVRSGAIVARIEPLPLDASVRQTLAQLAQWRAEREGVATQRPKTASLEQAQSRIRAAIATQQQAEAKVVATQAALEQAQRDLQRIRDLAAGGAISRQDRENAELNATTKAKERDAAILAARTAASEVDVAQAELKVLQLKQSDPDYLLKVYDARIASVSAELARLQADAKRTEVRSPVSGRVLKIRQQSAQYVTAGTPLLELADPGKLELVIDVLSSDALKIKHGNTILVNPGADTPLLRAKVRLIEPSAFTKVSALGVEEQRVNIIGDFVDASRLGDAYRVDVQIVVWQGKSVLQVPLSAIFRCQRTNWCVFTVQDGKAISQTVAIGQRSDLAAEILQGLQPGEIVVLHPTEQIQSGTPVKPR